MQKHLFSLSFLLTGICLQASAALSGSADILAKAPLRFEPSGRGEYLTRGLRFHAAIQPNGFLLASGDATMKLRFQGSSDSAVMASGKRLSSGTNILVGNDRSKWRTGIANFDSVSVSSLYPGVDMRYYGKDGNLEYDLMVAPQSDPGQIRLHFEGKQEPRIDLNGNLIAAFMQKQPSAFQLINGQRVSVASRYSRNQDGTIGIRLGKYDSSRQLVIDPVLTFAQYVAGTGQDIAYGVGRDSNGFLYVAGTTAATDITATSDAVKSANAGSFDLFVAKLDPTPFVDNPVVYVTYLGGANADNLKAMTVTPNGIVYLAGLTASSDFPMAGNSIQTTLSGTTDAFVAALDPSQASDSALIYSSYYGGTKDDTAYAIAAGSDGRIYLAGDTDSADLPTSNPYQGSLTGTEDMFVVVIDPGQTSAIFASYLGGSSTEYARGIAVLNDRTFWLSGGTYSSDYPIVGNPYSVNYNANCDVFLTHLDPTLGAAAVVYSTFLGGSGQDIAETLSIDGSGRLLLSGITTSADLPVTASAMQTRYGGAMDAFVAIFDPTLAPVSQLVYSTYYGGKSIEFATAMKADTNGVLHLVGYTASTNLPVTGDAVQKSAGGGYDGFYLKINPKVAGAAAMDYATYVAGPGTQILYGVEVDPNSNVYFAGYTTSAFLDALGGPSKGTGTGDIDAFVMGLNVCGYVLTPGSIQFPTAGGTSNLVVSAGKDCSYTVTGLPGWLTANPSSGTGTSTIALTAAPNTTGTARTSILTIAGQSFTVGQ